MPPGECARTKKRFLVYSVGRIALYRYKFTRGRPSGRRRSGGAPGAGRVLRVQGHPSRGDGGGDNARLRAERARNQDMNLGAIHEYEFSTEVRY